MSNRDDSGAVEPSNPGSPPRRRGGLVPGATIGGGRYRLLADHGGTHGMQFWQAHDTRLDRDVALTLVPIEPDARITAPEQTDILTRTLRLGRISCPGLTSVLDVVKSGTVGIVVAEWTPGESLRQASEAGTDPLVAARAVAALAGAAEEAHGNGNTLSIEHPDQIRISTDGNAVLAFPGTHGSSDVESDVRGLGAVLYAMLTGRWPLGTADVAVGGLEPAVRGDNGKLVDPAAIHPDMPYEISAVTMRALGADRGVRTAATVQHVLEQASEGHAETDSVPVVRLGQKAPEVSPERNRRTWLALAGLGAVTIVLLAFIGSWIMGLLAAGPMDGSLADQSFGLTSAENAPAEPGQQTQAPEPEGFPLIATNAVVYSPESEPDNPGDAGLAIDNDNSTKWQTDQYFRPFPALKEGVGLVLTLPRESRVLQAVIETDTPGTVVEIRTARSSNPEKLSDTKKVGGAELKSGLNTIKLDVDENVRYVLVWITTLTKPLNQSSLIEVSFTAPQE